MGDNHILPFLWMRGEPPEVLREEMGKIYEAGIRSVCLEARPHPEYAGERWWHDVDIIIEEAQRRDMQIWILDDAHFPTGMANDGMRRHPDKARRFLYTQFVDVTGPVPQAQVDVDLLTTRQITWMDLGKPQVQPLYDETRLLSVTASRIHDGDTIEGEVIDVTSQVENGYLTMDIPEGVWRINVNYVTTAIGPKPEYINYIDADSVRVLIDEVYERHYERYSHLFGTTIAGFFSDEPGFYNTDTYDENNYVGLRMALPWGAELESALSAEYGPAFYRDLPFLYAEESGGAHRAIRAAYMDVVSRLYSKNFSSQLGDWCRQHNVRYIGHIVEDNCGHMRLGAGCGHYFRAMAGQDIAGIDNIGYQIMPGNDVANRHTGFQDLNPEFYHYQLGKLGGSAAAIDPAKKGRLLCENFGAYGWRLGVRDMKWLVDYLVGQGVNYFVPHAFSMAEYPDVDCPPHFYARGNNPQFPYFCDLMRYTDRLCNLFSDGRNVPQVAVLYEAESDWTGETMRGSAIGKELLTHQIDYEFIPADVFADPEYYGCKVEENALVVNERSMKALIIPACEYLPVKAARYIAEHSEIPVIYVDRYPVGIAEAGENEADLLQPAIADKDIVPLKELAGYLIHKGIRDDVYVDRFDRNLHIYHYVKDGQNIYHLMNASLSATVHVRLHLPGQEYRYYDAMRDEYTAAVLQDGYTELTLPPYGATVILEGKADASEDLHAAVAVGEQAAVVTLDEFTLTLKEIGHSEPEVLEHFRPVPVSSFKRDYSGIMEYRTSVSIAQIPARAIFRAQYVFECMQVTVNGHTLPAVLTPPYEVDITSALQCGDNEIVISVASTALRNANTHPGIFGPERTILEPTGMFGDIEIALYEA